MPSKTTLVVNLSAFFCSSALVGIAIAAIYLASDAYELFTWRFPAGSYGWSPSHWYGDGRPGYSIRIGYNRSSEIKTYFAAAVALVLGMLGTFAFGLSFKRPAAPIFSRSLFAGASIACITITACAVWSAVAEVKIKHNTCWFEPAIANHQYWCSIENAACNTHRFSDETKSSADYRVLDEACLQFRHARFLVIPLAAISLVLAGLYAANVWFIKDKETENERADARVRLLHQHD
ncbi:hypothetical protein SVAN01_01151 [Stagonosporopsis vannaccii]|nr:hypothetical protein SVAN01_01151 [Stagonosporopsis vannaccii]